MTPPYLLPHTAAAVARLTEADRSVLARAFRSRTDVEPSFGGLLAALAADLDLVADRELVAFDAWERELGRG